MANNNFFDIALTILFPEAKMIITEIKAIRGISRATRAAFIRDLKNIKASLPQLKGTEKQIKTAQKALANALNTSEISAFRELLSKPQALSNRLGQMTAAERKEFGEQIADATGGVEESSLSSS